MKYETSTVSMIIAELEPPVIMLSHKCDTLLTHTTRTRIGRNLLSQLESQLYYEIAPLAAKVKRMLDQYQEDYLIESVLSLRRGAHPVQDQCMLNLFETMEYMVNIYRELGQTEREKKLKASAIPKLLSAWKRHTELFEQMIAPALEYATFEDDGVNVDIDKLALEMELV